MLDFIVKSLAFVDVVVGLCGFFALYRSPGLAVEKRLTRKVVFFISSSMLLSGVILWMS